MNDTTETIELRFVKQDNTVLSLPTQPWSEKLGIDANSLVREMMSLMIINGGIGLAAPQVGIDASVFVIGNESNSMACFNP